VGSSTEGEGSVYVLRSRLDSDGDGWPDSIDNDSGTPWYTDVEPDDLINGVDPYPEGGS
jgi:hypothetical protein